MDITSFILGSVAGAKSASGLRYLVVEELPQVGQNNIIYLVPKSTSKTNNYYDEYMWINNAWELIGDTQVDLSNYVQNTDYATDNKGGVIKTGSNAVGITNGKLYSQTLTYSQYEAYSGNTFIGKGTLENVIDGKGLITQYSTMPTASASTVGKIIQYIGTTSNDYTNGYFYIGTTDGQDPATYSWENINVQPSSGGGRETIILYNQNLYMFDPIVNNNANKEKLKYIYDNWSNIENIDIYFKVGTSQYDPIVKGNVNKYNATDRIQLTFEYPTLNNTNGYGIGYYQTYSYNIVFNYINSNIELYTLKNNTKYIPINRLHALGVSNTTEYTPTGDYNPSTKLYTDKTHYENMTGYDATKTQVLKNVQGVLQWITEE